MFSRQNGLLEERDALLEAHELELIELRTALADLEKLGAEVAELRQVAARLTALD